MPIVTNLLVANRGEIARRVFRTCRSMGIGTVGVFSEPDRQAPFVLEADQAVALGGAAPAESYLRVEAVLQAARVSGADAIHPGYGFLAENADFAREVIDAGLTWIGPSVAAIETMGSKLASKRLMHEAGVPTLPSIDITGMSEDEVADSARRIGFPVLVKASAGGGGKGMRVVDREDRLIEAAAGARREAASAFGDDTVFIEAYLSQPRHVEIQVFGDTHGHIVSLFERECSIQRRHQKIIEESPSPAVDEGLRQRMGDAAVAAARAVDYVGAGTVEFLLSGGEFSFLEMNTRLQVEHPVTEAVTGLDLVRLQILVAEGKALPPEALAPSMSGHAIEARLYAEDPANGFLPVTGTLHQVRFPAHPGLRVDSGVEDGSVISVDYDPMLAKVVAWGRSREEAARRLSAALRRTRLHGSTTNRELLARILTTDEFLAGRTDTAFLDRHDPAMLSAPLVPPVERGRAALAAALAAQAERVAGWKVLTTVPSGFRNNPAHFQTTRFTVGAEEVEVDYRFDGRGRLSGRVDGESQAQVILHQCTPARVGLEVDGHLMWFDIERAGPFHHVDGPSGPVTLLEHPRFPHSAPDEAPGSLQAPMPGRIVRIEVSVGDRVAEGAAIVVLEAMKMEHTLRAPVAGVVAEVKTAVGDQVDADQVLAVVEEG